MNQGMTGSDWFLAQILARQIHRGAETGPTALKKKSATSPISLTCSMATKSSIEAQAYGEPRRMGSGLNL
jgi:hypothetical protein